MPPVTDSTFDELVRDALDELPDWVLPYLEDVAIQVVDRADPALGDLYGLYEGVPVGGDPVGLPPPSISIFREPLERDFGRDPARLAHQVRITVMHEIAHHFGIDDDRLGTLGYG
jgi:predicted Zn-dependent protease with MMP-like domain